METNKPKPPNKFKPSYTMFAVVSSEDALTDFITILSHVGYKCIAPLAYYRREDNQKIFIEYTIVFECYTS